MSNLTNPLQCPATCEIPSVLEEADNNYRRWEILSYERLVGFDLVSCFTGLVCI